MKTYLTTLTLTLTLLYLADTTITWRPFSISFGRGMLVLGYILIAIGGTIIYYQGRWDSLKRSAEIKKEVREEVEQQQQTIKSEL